MLQAMGQHKDAYVCCVRLVRAEESHTFSFHESGAKPCEDGSARAHVVICHIGEERRITATLASHRSPPPPPPPPALARHRHRFA